MGVDREVAARGAWVCILPGDHGRLKKAPPPPTTHPLQGAKTFKGCRGQGCYLPPPPHVVGCRQRTFLSTCMSVPAGLAAPCFMQKDHANLSLRARQRCFVWGARKTALSKPHPLAVPGQGPRDGPRGSEPCLCRTLAVLVQREGVVLFPLHRLCDGVRGCAWRFFASKMGPHPSVTPWSGRKHDWAARAGDVARGALCELPHLPTTSALGLRKTIV